METEIWKDIDWFEWKYQVSNLWGIRSISYRRTWNIKNLVPHSNGLWYMQVHINSLNIRKKNHLLHRIVANTFIKNINNYPQVNHIDWNKLNNSVVNLEWVTSSENHLHAFSKLNRIHNSKWKFGKYNNSSKKVIQITKENEIIKIWHSMTDIQMELWFFSWSIWQCCKWKLNYVGWFKWKYLKDLKQCITDWTDTEILLANYITDNWYTLSGDMKQCLRNYCNSWELIEPIRK